MKRYLLIALVAALVGASAALLMKGPGPIWRSELGQRALIKASERPVPEGVTVARLGETLPDVRVHTLDGEQIALPLPEGRPVLINVWATWCPPCVREMPELADFARSQGRDGVQVIGVALDEAEAVTAWLQRQPSPYMHFRDDASDRDAGVMLGNPAGLLPYSVLVAADGRVLRQRLGPFSSKAEIEAWSARAER